MKKAFEIQNNSEKQIDHTSLDTIKKNKIDNEIVIDDTKPNILQVITIKILFFFFF